MPKPAAADLRVKELIKKCRMKPGMPVHLHDHNPAWAGAGELRRLREDTLRKRAKALLERNIAELYGAQELLWADDRRGVLVVLQAMDAAGKDGVIKHVASGLNPQGCEVRAFKRPSPDELDHTFLWRSMRALPERGKIVIFNRSHYEDVLVVRVHPELLEQTKLPPGKRGDKFWNDRYEDINNLERHLDRNGTLILKFFLNVSKAEQKRRFLDRLKDPNKRWKFSLGDLEERAFWDDYQRAYEHMITHTCTPWAPWYIVPADNKWVTRAIVAAILSTSIRRLDLRYPHPDKGQQRALAHARQQLLKE